MCIRDRCNHHIQAFMSKCVNLPFCYCSTNVLFAINLNFTFAVLSPPPCVCAAPDNATRCGDFFCLFGGTCTANNTCQCVPSFYGDYCANSTECVCANGGTCNANDTCDCPPGFGGYRCSMKLCDPECQNGGLCSNGVCFCPLPYRGSTCGEYLTLQTLSLIHIS